MRKSNASSGELRNKTELGDYEQVKTDKTWIIVKVK